MRRLTCICGGDVGDSGENGVGLWRNRIAASSWTMSITFHSSVLRENEEYAKAESYDAMFLPPKRLPSQNRIRSLIRAKLLFLFELSSFICKIMTINDYKWLVMRFFFQFIWWIKIKHVPLHSLFERMSAHGASSSVG